MNNYRNVKESGCFIIVYYYPQPLLVVANKCDVKKISELSEESQVSPPVDQNLLLALRLSLAPSTRSRNGRKRSGFRNVRFRAPDSPAPSGREFEKKKNRRCVDGASVSL